MARRRLGVELDHDGMRAMLQSSEMAAEMRRRAEAVADQARATAPVVTGNYRNSITVETDVTEQRALARVVADVPYAMDVEARESTLGRAVDAAGD